MRVRVWRLRLAKTLRCTLQWLHARRARVPMMWDSRPEVGRWQGFVDCEYDLFEGRTAMVVGWDCILHSLVFLISQIVVMGGIEACREKSNGRFARSVWCRYVPRPKMEARDCQRPGRIDRDTQAKQAESRKWWIWWWAVAVCHLYGVLSRFLLVFVKVPRYVCRGDVRDDEFKGCTARAGYSRWPWVGCVTPATVRWWLQA